MFVLRKIKQKVSFLIGRRLDTDIQRIKMESLPKNMHFKTKFIF